MFRTYLYLFLSFVFVSTYGQNIPDHVEPPSWWVGMKNPYLQILVHGTDIAKYQVVLTSHPGITLDSVSKTNNPNYLFLHLSVRSGTSPGNFYIDFSKDGKRFYRYVYELKKREKASALRDGFGPSDVIYLLMPDRFANGDPSNDEVKGMKEGLNRKAPYGRHGGDIQGIIDHLDYIKEMGFTGLWPTPVLENDQPEQSYHGYAITDFYRVDPRLGTNDLYRQLGHACKKNGIKLIMDMVFNHCGSVHWWMKDLPSSDWINEYPVYFITNHVHSVNMDPHASRADRIKLTKGWFVPTMPDLNQKNPFLANYLIQNSIWWIEFAGLQGIRMDTYPYPDKDFMARWTRRIREEYPHFMIVGEEWNTHPSFVSYWQKGQTNRDGYKPGLPSLMDFPLQQALSQSLTEKENWNSGWRKLYDVLARDFVYPSPENLVIFGDNHDMNRFFRQIHNDTAFFRLGMAFLLTTRGIPQIFYGTELLMSNKKDNDHGTIRSDFPGGWPGDTANAFTGENINPGIKRIQDEMKSLLNWRKNEPAVQSGRLIHFVPENGVYVYFRSTPEKTIMVLLNKNRETTHLNTGRFDEITGKYVYGVNIYDHKSYPLHPVLDVPPYTPLILELH